ncbi:hypothetical protein G7046_g8210 [Stylonectria norvegica]|nr:hypothetical protein G7046_g8210 [Stylonectria norvegica]
MYRTCCIRLESSRTWTRRATLCARQLSQPRLRGITTSHHDAALGLSPSGGSILDQLRIKRRDGSETTHKSRPTETPSARNQSKPRRTYKDEQDGGPGLASARSSKPDSPLKRPWNRPSDFGSSPKSRGPARWDRSRKAGEAQEPRHKSGHELDRIDGKAGHKVTPSIQSRRDEARYIQWGYMRHQLAASERKAASRKYDLWNSSIDRILDQQGPTPLLTLQAGESLFELESVAEMRNTWESKTLDERTRTWPEVMLSTLMYHPDKAARVLEATMEPLPPGYAIHDTLKLIARNLPAGQQTRPREHAANTEAVLDLFAKVMEDLPAGHVYIQQSTIGILAKKLPSVQVAELYRVLCRVGTKLHRNTRLQIASQLARSFAHKQTAFGILQDMADEEGVDLNQNNYASVITTLLHQPYDADGWNRQEGSFSPQRALQYFIERGYAPNVINFTALLESLISQGDVAEAIRLPLILAENGVELDARCFSAVFKAAKNSLELTNIKGAFDVAKAANVPEVDVLNNALHSIFYFAEIEGREKKHSAPWVTPMFIPMLRIYAKRFDLEPLQWLLPDSLPLILTQADDHDSEKFRVGPGKEWAFRNTIVPTVDEFFSKTSGPRIQPTTVTLATMLRAYIRSLSRPYDLLAFYTFFKSRLEERGLGSVGSRLIKEQGSIVHDSLILVMCERRALTRPALQIFGDMLRDSLKARGTEEDKKVLAGDASLDAVSNGQASSETSSEVSSTEDGLPAHVAPATGEAVVVPTEEDTSPVHPAPSLFTFSILIHGLLMRGEKALGEQVLQVMMENDIPPNMVTWNSLVKGYASMQNISRTVGALQDLEAAGFKPNVHTFKAFDRLSDQGKALEQMDSIIAENRKKLEAALVQQMQ